MIHIDRADGIAILTLAGEFDLANVPDVERALGEIPLEQRAAIDLSAVTFVDSSLLNALVRRHRRARAPFVVIVPSTSPVRRVFTLTNLHTYLRLVSHRADALAFVRDQQCVTIEPNSTTSNALAGTDLI